MRAPPERECDWRRIDMDPGPARDLVAAAAQFALASSANRDCVLVADLSSSRSRLSRHIICGTLTRRLGPPYARLLDHDFERTRQESREHARRATVTALSALPIANGPKRGSGDFGELLLCEASLQPSLRHERAVNFQNWLSHARTRLALRVVQGVA